MHYLYFRFESGFQIVLVQVKYSISDTAFSWFRKLDKQKKKNYIESKLESIEITVGNTNNSI